MRSTRLLLVALALALAGPSDAVAPRPHIVIFLADDLGWGDVGYHDSEIETPQIDRLAAAGVRLEQFYVWPVCSPTRASLLTGRYPTRYGLQGGVVVPHATHGLPTNERTLADALREAGYRTAIVGKWHLGHAKPEYLPTRRGFDHQYGLYNGQIDYYTHLRDGGLDWHRDDRALREEGYATDLMAAEAVRLVESHDPERPLFLYVPFLAPHTPLQRPPGVILPTHAGRPVFAAMVESMDAAMGRVLGALEARGMRDDTLVLFFSDNGANERFGGRNEPLRGGKYQPYEGGVRSPAVAHWPGQLEGGVVRQGMMHVIDWYPTLLRLAGATLEQELPLDGVDQWPMLARGEASARNELLLVSYRAWEAIRIGKWKYLIRYGRAAKKQSRRKKQAKNAPERSIVEMELYDLVADPEELENLAMRRRDSLAPFAERLREYRETAAPENRAGPVPPGFRAPPVWGEALPVPDSASD